jgi:hypothetical protein
MTVELVRDGKSILALISPDLQAGISGAGDTVPEALRNLAGAIERENWQFLDLARKPAGLIRVK